ncbi:hypothetical protein G6F57_002190 [Rhizopus arrhizus]|uniref:NmrA-like domain-containing protein n=1 Tax=Rhizopus oryzae TaxID=64495 RepID=A0A9P6XID4_RHIOR|nr:hypothetical protein G6F23_010301 [Rhizopus arrhizus]KAG1428353.1 hypothetical protein G6F58_000608 [Rhizopus delemar]KAG0758757.1 hypothetical protein G6F24_009570 [Rhizopus arrhizus]KAG0775977.1 hypothetical protein G6F22_012912 [Rhizopus arrhizus]KAG0794380.1 hypothetical protein G6F21_002905 [Rhizopus arrhizus]
MSANTNTRNVCIITNGDSFLGFAMAYRMLQAQKKGEDNFAVEHKLRVLCRNRHGYGFNLLEKMGADVMEVDYKDEEKLRQALKDARTVALIPEKSHDSLKEAEHMIKVSHYHKVEFFCMHSFVGVDRIEERQADEQHKYHNIMKLHKIEKMVKEHFHENHCIVRHSRFNQYFYFMAPQIEGENMLALPVRENAKWGCIDINDVTNAIYKLASMEHDGRGKKSSKMKKLYEFTPMHTMTSKEIAREIGVGLGREGLHFKEISEHQMKEYLRRMRDDKRFKERPVHHEQNWREEIEKLERDGPWSFPLGKYLHDHAVEMMMEGWHLANADKQDICTNDLKEILNAEPRSVKEYFKKNRDNFKEFK